jgi:membrane-associated PAP2 superfamily phosphatase
VIALVFALGVGWSMGLYKMIIGDHFLSHTVITMILAWLIVLIIAKSVYRFSKL